MPVCKRCKGTGQLPIVAQVLKDGKFIDEPPVIIECVFCEGTGTVSQVLLDAEKDFWCRCGNPSGESTYYPDCDGVKHHYRCNDCGKVTQVG